MARANHQVRTAAMSCMQQHETSLPESFNKRRGLNVTNGATQFNYADIWTALLTINRHFRNLLNPVLDSICDVWDNLYSLA